MRINFYDARLEDSRTVLVKEKAMNYTTDKLFAPSSAVKLLNDIVSLNVMGEEYCYLLALNGKAHLLGIFFISKGTANQTLLSPREIFMRSLLIGASMIVICHNHPSGSPKPSKADITMTDQIKKVGELVDIPLADHLIIAEDTYFSFMENGLL